MTICLAGKTILLLTESKGTSSWVSALFPPSGTPEPRLSGQAVTWLATQGIRQFIDVGCGLPTKKWLPTSGQDGVIPGSRTPHRSAGQGQPGDQPGGRAVEVAVGGLGRAGLNVFTGLQEFGKQRGGARRAIGGDRQVRHVLADLGGHYLG